MKRFKYFLFIAVFSLVSSSAVASDSDPGNTDPQERVDQLEERVQQIWKMDFSDMDKEEKALLKMEVKEIKKELKKAGLDNKVSISVGAIIIIILLLILLT